MRLLRHPKILTDNSPKLHRLSTKPKANAAMLVSLKHHNGFTLMKLLGKRTVGNFTAFDLLVALMLGEIVDEIIYGDGPWDSGFGI
jgi:hypothetical protein